MLKPQVSGAMAIGAILALMFAPAATAQIRAPTALAAPDYGSGASAGALSNDNFNTPESDGRPGVKFFALGVQAFRKGDFRHAIDMYKVAASWAYKPAEYNLGVMYFKGQGVPADHARGAAWMILAAERGDATYVQARDLMVTALTDAEFERTDAIWRGLKSTYGDAVALRRAKAQWRRVATEATGSHLGHAMGNLRVGALDQGHSPRSATATAVSAAQLTQGGSVDGSVAYRQFQQSDDPYDPVFEKARKGVVTVEPLQPVKPAATRKSTKASAPIAQPGTNPQNM